MSGIFLKELLINSNKKMLRFGTAKNRRIAEVTTRLRQFVWLASVATQLRTENNLVEVRARTGKLGASRMIRLMGRRSRPTPIR